MYIFNTHLEFNRDSLFRQIENRIYLTESQDIFVCVIQA